ncbi:MAG: type II toxin-antitoxin system HicB family antitoxin [Armatimonadetes bacterium]|nr:type II toxin-antitoxin system HicB family antitoxin [Armatimonadota bacterium]
MTEREMRALAQRYEIRILPTVYGDYRAVVPAFEASGDRLITGGDTPPEALANAYEAIELAILGRLEDGRPLPAPVEPIAA